MTLSVVAIAIQVALWLLIFRDFRRDEQTVAAMKRSNEDSEEQIAEMARLNQEAATIVSYAKGLDPNAVAAMDKIIKRGVGVLAKYKSRMEKEMESWEKTRRGSKQR